MHVIARKTLREFWNRHPAAQKALEAWFYEAEEASWESSSHVQATHKAACQIGKDRVIFNIQGIQYRLIVRINLLVSRKRYGKQVENSFH